MHLGSALALKEMVFKTRDSKQSEMAQPRPAYAKLEGVVEGSDAPFVRFIEATSVTLGRDRKDKSVREIQLGGNKALSRKVQMNLLVQLV